MNIFDQNHTAPPRTQETWLLPARAATTHEEPCHGGNSSARCARATTRFISVSARWSLTSGHRCIEHGVSFPRGTPHRLSQRKPNGLPYKWPLLADGQDPDALEARLAYHLHRLNLTGEPLREALKGKAYLATAVSQGRATIGHDFITTLAADLNIASDELTRSLGDEEAHQWSFYRHSAQHRAAVWENANAFMRANNISIREAATATGLDFSDLAKAISGKRPRVLELHQALRLTSFTNPPTDPHSLLPPPSR